MQATDSEVKICSQIIKHEKMNSTHLILQVERGKDIENYVFSSRHERETKKVF